MSGENQPSKGPRVVTWQELLEDCAPGGTFQIKEGVLASPRDQVRWSIHIPRVDLYCPSKECERKQSFIPAPTYLSSIEDKFHPCQVSYTCPNCSKYSKRFTFFLIGDDRGFAGTGPVRVIKLGEWPRFGPIVPPRVRTMLRGDLELFHKGLTAERLGFGIAAFAYYRRVVENQKMVILEELMKGCRKLNASADVLNELEAARKEQRFTTAIEKIKHGLPDSLMIEGQNPLILLHTPLSHGLHSLSEAECLDLAADIRVVLTHLCDRIAASLEEQTEVKTAVQRLITKRTGSQPQS